MASSGIYSIVNTINGNEYVGSAVNIQKRWTLHRHKLRNNKHHNSHLQSAWNKYGEDAFCFTVLETCGKTVLLKREQHHLDARRPKYNVAKCAGNKLGVSHTKETKRKMSDAAKGRVFTAEHRAALAAAKKGKKVGQRPAGWRENISKALKVAMKNADRSFMDDPEYKAKQSARMKEIWAIRKQGGI